MDYIHTGKESLKICQILIDGIGNTNLKDENETIIKALNKLMAYKAIGTRKNLKELKEKSVPTLPKRIVTNANKEHYSVIYKCPNCHHHLLYENKDGFYNGMMSNFCQECGKALLWKFT